MEVLPFLLGLVVLGLTATVFVGLWLRATRRLDDLEQRLDNAGRRLADGDALLHAILDNVPDAMVVLDAQQRVLEHNARAAALHGDVTVGKHCREVFDSCTPSACEACALTGHAEAARTAVRTAPRTGDVLAMEFRPFTGPEGEKRSLIIERVITHQRKLQARVVHQEKMAAFGLMAAGIAHDMGNPLSAIAMHLELIDDAGLSDEGRGDLDVVRQEVGRLRRTLREMVLFARRRRDEVGLVSARSAIDDALAVLRHDRRMKPVNLFVSSDPETPAVHVVEDHLVQVVTNLVVNSLDAMPDGGDLSIDVRHVKGTVAIRVRDTGAGMDASTLRRCMEPMFTTKAEGKGTGLGLSICRDILLGAGGHLDMHSVPNKGTTAIITLPAAAVRSAA